jgi:hypothetical protein
MELLLRYLRDRNPVMAKIADEIATACDTLWAPAQAPWFTEHGTGHSRRIGQYVEQIIFGVRGALEADPLRPEEMLVLIGSCYLHDVGMQFTRGVGELAAPGDLVSFSPVPLFYDTVVRRRHAHIVHRLICGEQAEDRPLRDLGLHGCPADLCQAIAEVSLSHGVYGYLEQLAGDRAKGLRLDLLGALLQIGDVLDVTRERVNRRLMNWVYLPNVSYAHWLLSTHVASVTIDSVGRIRVNYEVPADVYRDAILAHDLREAVEQFWIERLSREARDVLEHRGGVKLLLPSLEGGRYSNANEAMAVRPAAPGEQEFDVAMLRAWRGDFPQKDDDIELVRSGHWPRSTVLRSVMYALLLYAGDEMQRRRAAQSRLPQEIEEADVGVARACGITVGVAGNACDKLVDMGVIVGLSRKTRTDTAARWYVLNTDDVVDDRKQSVWYWLPKVRRENPSLWREDRTRNGK